jgi:hypothetical protein
VHFTGRAQDDHLPSRPGVSTTRPLFVPPTPIRPFNSPARPTSTSTSTTGAQDGAVRHHVGKTPQPRLFEGTDEEKMRAGYWLRSVNGYLRLEHKYRPDDELVEIFCSLLKGQAETWFRMEQELEGAAWTLERVFEAFLAKFTGESTNVLLQAKLEALTFSRKKDFTTFASQWQNLVAQLCTKEYALGEGPDSVLLGELFAAVIKKGDVAVWAKAIDSAPQGLSEWKAAVQRAITVIKVVDEARAKATGSNAYSVRSYHSARVNVMDGSEGETENERGEGESAEVNQMQGKSRQAGGGQQGNRPAPVRLYTDEEFAKVKKLGLCFYCGSGQHRLVDCENRKAGKPRSRATPAQLKA